MPGMGTSEVERVARPLAKALREHCWSRGAQGPRALRPYIALREYVRRAWELRLEAQEECQYTGALLMDSVLETTGRRHTDSVEEANGLFLAATRLARHLWETLEREGVEGFERSAAEVEEFLRREAEAG